MLLVHMFSKNMLQINTKTCVPNYIIQLIRENPWDLNIVMDDEGKMAIYNVHYVGTRNAVELRVGCCKGLAHISSSSPNYHQFWAENLETTREANYHIPMAINT